MNLEDVALSDLARSVNRIRGARTITRLFADRPMSSVLAFSIVGRGGQDYRSEPNPGIRFRVPGNGDSVSCADNGATGLFGHGIEGLNLNRVSVPNVANLGVPGSAKPGRYKGSDDALASSAVRRQE